MGIVMFERKTMDTEASAIIEGIRKFILERIPKARQLKVGNDEKLLENGLLDSLGMLDVVTFLENEFHISADDEDLTPENFQSIDTMSAFVLSKQNVFHDSPGKTQEVDQE